MAHVSHIPVGRYGNFNFTCAASIGYCKLHDLEYSAPSKTNDPKWNSIYYPWLIAKNYNPNLPQIVIKEQQHSYYELPFKESWRNKNIILHGYFQSEKYFLHCREDIIKAFAIPYKRLDGYVGIHWRRGDYLNLTNKHIVFDYEWIKKVVLFFIEKGYKSFVVISDDISYAKKTLPPLKIYNAEFSFSDSNDEIADMALFSCCEHQICSPSTMSFWGAWLNQNPDKIIVITKDWFVKGKGNLDDKDIVPSTWLKM